MSLSSLPPNAACFCTYLHLKSPLDQRAFQGEKFLNLRTTGTNVSKQRGETHLKEDDSERLVKSLLPAEWVIRKLHPDYGVDVTIEVFERQEKGIPTMGEFLFVQLKGTTDLKRKVEPIRVRGNAEKRHDRQEGKVEYELDAVTFVVDTDTIDNARLMGPSTPLMLFVCELNDREVYLV